MTRDLPLADVKILDLMWAIAGPAATRVLADYGATVIRVESRKRFDAIRNVGPFHELPPTPECSACFHNLNAGKRMMTLDMTRPASRDVVLDLVRWADVVTESFAPTAKRTWGLEYETLRAVKPDLIMLSTCLMGQTGPLASFAGFGNLAGAVTGFYELTGWPDRSPAGPFGAYTDYVAPRFSTAAILAALDHRRRTGEGQFIDLAQAEASLHFLAPAILDCGVNGRVPRRAGNRDPEMAPHGVFPCAGDDRWVAIAVRSDEEFRALGAVIARLDLAADPRLADLAGRQAHADEVDAALAAWTSTREPLEVETALQAAGIPASVVMTSPELVADPQLLHRGHFLRLAHPQYGTTPIEGSRFTLSRTPAHVEGSAPTFGRDNDWVLRTVLGYDDARIAALAADGVLE